MKDVEEIPEGKIRTRTGEIVDRTRVVFTLRPHPTEKNVLIALDGTMYDRDVKGTLRKRRNQRWLQK